MGAIRRTLFAAALAASCLLGTILAQPARPTLEITSAPELASQAALIRGYAPAHLAEIMSLVGLEEPGPPIHVELVTEDSPAARAAPAWATGYAEGAGGRVVLIPSRSFAYPYGSLEALVHHEVAHVLIARACGGGAVPRWFNEGLAMAAARTWDVEDRTRLVIEMTPGGDEPFSSVDDRFHGGRGSANRAYALSGAFVRDLLQRHGRLLPANIFRRMREGRAFDEAYLEATGESLPWAERDFYRRQNIWSRWVPWLTSAFTLWTVISILALIAIQRRRARDARKKEEWDREEAALFAPDPRDLPN